MPRFTRSFAALLATSSVVVVLSTAWALAAPMATQCALATDGTVTAAGVTTDNAFVERINEVRQSQGLNTLVVDPTLAQIAQDWSNQMATAGEISHRPDLHAGVSPAAGAMGENVGEGGSVDDLMTAFVASSHHYSNLVDPRFTHVGVGSAVSANGMLFTTHEFSSARVTAVAVMAEAPVTAPSTPRVTVPRPVRQPTTTTQAPPTTVIPTTTSTTLAPTTTAPTNIGTQHVERSLGRCAAPREFT